MTHEELEKLAVNTHALLSEIAGRVLAYDYVLQADCEAQLSAFQELGRVFGVEVADRDLMRQTFFRVRNEHLERALLETENVDPSAAAFIQALVDRYKHDVEDAD